MAILWIHALNKGSGSRSVLRGLDLDPQPGEVFALEGPNGAGKSPLLRLCAGPLDPGGGRIRICGMAPGLARRHGWIGCSTSGEGSLTRRLSLAANLILIAQIAGLSSREAEARIHQLAELLEIESHLSVPAERCSSGLRQRAPLARARVSKPRLSILDDPLPGIDPESCQRLASRLGATWCDEAVLWVTHAPEQTARAAARGLRLEAGTLHPT